MTKCKLSKGKVCHSAITLPCNPIILLQSVSCDKSVYGHTSF